jgi:hypothetical protein
MSFSNEEQGRGSKKSQNRKSSEAIAVFSFLVGAAILAGYFAWQIISNLLGF